MARKKVENETLAEMYEARVLEHSDKSRSKPARKPRTSKAGREPNSPIQMTLTESTAHLNRTRMWVASLILAAAVIVFIILITLK